MFSMSCDFTCYENVLLHKPLYKHDSFVASVIHLLELQLCFAVDLKIHACTDTCYIMFLYSSEQDARC